MASDGFAADVTRQHANVIEAANRRQIAHVVFTSIVDVEDSSPFYFAPVYRDAERLLKASRFATSIIRCGLYCEFIHRHWLKDPAISLPLTNAQIAPVSRDDVAVAAVESLLHLTHGTWDLTGSKSYSMTELARAATNALKRKFTYQACTQGEYLARLEAEMPPPWPIAFATLCASVREGRYSAVSTQHLKTLSRRAEDFEGYLQRHAIAARNKDQGRTGADNKGPFDGLLFHLG